MMRLTTRYHFAASHRLDSKHLSPEENQRLYDKCNNPYGHGHDYVMEVTVEGVPGPDGQLVNREALHELVRRTVLNKVDHRDLNRDVAEFEGGVTTTENLAYVVRQLLEQDWNLPGRLVRLQISETARNIFAWERGVGKTGPSPMPAGEAELTR